jgi:positive phototaxis protein PixI
MNHFAQAAGGSIAQQFAQQFIRCALSGARQTLLPTQQLLEILGAAQTPIIPIPDMPDAVMGVCNWRGEVLWLVDLSSCLGFDPLPFSDLQRKAYKTLICKAGSHTVGFVVTQVEQMVWLERSQILPLPNPPTHSVLALALQGYYAAPAGEMVLVLDGIAVMNALCSEFSRSLTV